MKFYQKEYDTFRSLIAAADLDYAPFSFSKKRGILLISFNSAETFEFRRIDQTILNEEKHWEKRTDYWIGYNQIQQKGIGWEKVELEFNAWLRSLNQS